MNVSSLSRVAAAGVLGVVAASAGLVSAGVAQAATAAPTRTTISTTTPNVVLGQNAKLKVVVKPVTGTSLPTGTVTFNEGVTVLGTATLALVNNAEIAKLTVPGLAFGPHSITATYSGNASFAASTSLNLVVNVTKNATTTTLTEVASTNPGQYKLNATVKIVPPGTGIPSGLVTFVVDGGAPQIVALNAYGKAPLAVTFVVGSVHSVTASYSGGSTVASSTGTLTFTAA